MPPMTPLPDRAVIVAILSVIGLCFALVFWTVRLQPARESPLLWRQAPPTQPSNGLPQEGARLL